MLHLNRSDAASLRELEREFEDSRPDVARVIRKVLGQTQGEPAPAYVTTTEAAAVIGVSAQTVRNWIDRGWLSARRSHPLAHRRISRQELDRLLDFRARLTSHGVEPRSDGQLEALLSRHSEDRRRRRIGEPISGPGPTQADAAEVAGRR